jgi:hypothetical protein
VEPKIRRELRADLGHHGRSPDRRGGRDGGDRHAESVGEARQHAERGILLGRFEPQQVAAADLRLGREGLLRPAPGSSELLQALRDAGHRGHGCRVVYQ